MTHTPRQPSSDAIHNTLEDVADQGLIYATPDGTIHYDSRLERLIDFEALGFSLSVLLDHVADHLLEVEDGELEIQWPRVLKELRRYRPDATPAPGPEDTESK